MTLSVFYCPEKHGVLMMYTLAVVKGLYLPMEA